MDSLFRYFVMHVSQGLARQLDSNHAHLAVGDAPREGGVDGRGILSDRTLTEFCKFFPGVCLDQARYMDGLLALGGLVSRLEGYVQLREKGMIPGSGGVTAPLRAEVTAVLRAAAVKGEITRGQVARLIGMSERTGRDVLRGLLEEGLLVSNSVWGPTRLGFPAHAAGHLFPDLYPPETHAGQTEAAERLMREGGKALNTTPGVDSVPEGDSCPRTCPLRRHSLAAED